MFMELNAFHYLHCRLMIRAGEVDFDTDIVDGEYKKVIPDLIKIHPGHVKGQASYDLAVIKVETPFKFDQYVGQVCLPEAKFKNLDERDNHFVRLLGEKQA